MREYGACAPNAKQANVTAMRKLCQQETDQEEETREGDSKIVFKVNRNECESNWKTGMIFGNRTFPASDDNWDQSKTIVPGQEFKGIEKQTSSGYAFDMCKLGRRLLKTHNLKQKEMNEKFLALISVSL